LSNSIDALKELNQIQMSDENEITSDLLTKVGSEENKFFLLNTKPSISNNPAEDEKQVFKIFEIEWQRGPSRKQSPIMMKNVHNLMQPNLWSSAWFEKQYTGKHDIKVDLINCENGREIKDTDMSSFWKGFDSVGEAILCDQSSKKLLTMLKPKDWPPAKDFAHVLPEQYNDLMRNLPVKEYCNRDGALNLVANLPDHCLKPDLGPKLYIAYSSADSPKVGTTNLHIDISDAFNVILYVGQNCQIDEKEKEMKKKDSMVEFLKNCDISQDQIDRYTIGGERPGAIWHIFKTEDAEKIREFLSEYESDKKTCSDDCIHDQRFYLDKNMLANLKAA
jgi:[histone H3]-dimethyl-L-lysine9 demethylase